MYVSKEVQFEGKWFNFFLLKVASRCNLNCSYCYEYNSVDTSWKVKPKFMSDKVVRSALFRIKQHVEKHHLQNITIIFHGGEPLLASYDFFKSTVHLFKQELSQICQVKFGLQTNGVLLDEKWIDLFSSLDIGIGISVDGYEEINDKARIMHTGKSSFKELNSALNLLREKKIKFGTLSVMQMEADPIKNFLFLSAFKPFQIDFLFPHHNHVNPPAYVFNPKEGYGYGKWLSIVFDYWWSNDLSNINIRIFSDIIHLLLGGKYATESLGLAPIGIAAIQTDGSYEAVDSLKSTFDGAVSTGKSVFNTALDDIMGHDLIGSRIDRASNLCEDCKTCKYVKVCGGGYLPHRYHKQKYFNAPSIYCHDLMYLINHIAEKMLEKKDIKIDESVLRVLEPIN